MTRDQQVIARRLHYVAEFLSQFKMVHMKLAVSD